MYFSQHSRRDRNAFFAKTSGRRSTVTEEEQNDFQDCISCSLLQKNITRRDWVMQLHYRMQDVTTMHLMYAKLGPDTGFDCIDNYASQLLLLQHFLNSIMQPDELPKTILYSLNPNDNAIHRNVLGCFQDSSAVGKIQQGSAWWFNDHKTGMTEQMTSLANLGLLRNLHRYAD